MPFKIKDLMIHVLDPKAAQPGLCRVPSVQCTAPNSLCTAINSICRVGTHCLPITLCETLPTVCQLPTHCPIHTICAIPTHCAAPTFCAIPTHCPAPTLCAIPTHCAVPTLCAIPSHCAAPTLCAFPTHCGAPSICAIPSNCGVLSPCGAISPCGGLQSLCGPCSATFDPTIVERGDPAEGLAALKAQLKEAIANVEAHEALTQESLLPQTVAEADDLTKRLQGAIEALQARKADLQKRETKK